MVIYVDVFLKLKKNMQNQYVTVSLQNQPEAVRAFLLRSYGEADMTVEAAVQCLPCLLMSILLHGRQIEMNCDISSDILFIFSIRCLSKFIFLSCEIYVNLFLQPRKSSYRSM